jgi:hypothetical protein
MQHVTTRLRLSEATHKDHYKDAGQDTKPLRSTFTPRGSITELYRWRATELRLQLKQVPACLFQLCLSQSTGMLGVSSNQELQAEPTVPTDRSGPAY